MIWETRRAELTTDRVADHLAALARRPSKRHPGARVNGVVPNVVIGLRSMLNAAVKARAGGLQAFDFPQAPKHRRVRPEDEHGDVATPQEVQAFTQAMPEPLRIAGPRWRAWVCVSLPGGLDCAWRAAREDAGRPGFHFHNLRHTGLSKYAQQEATLAELLHRGAYTDVTVALRYQHATAQRDRALTEGLSSDIEA